MTMLIKDDRAWPHEINTTSTTGSRSPATASVHSRWDLTPGELIVRTQRDVDAVVIALYGELDLATCACLQRKLRHAINERPQRLIVDLSGLRFMDIQGLRVLLDAAERCREDNRRLSFLRGIPLVQRLFELTGNESALTFDD